MSSNVSSDLIWAITRNNSSYIVKRGPVKDQIVFTKEPLSLTNQHTRKHSGLVNEKVGPTAITCLSNSQTDLSIPTGRRRSSWGERKCCSYVGLKERQYRGHLLMGDVIVITKRNAGKHGNKPASLCNRTAFSKHKSNRNGKLYRALTNRRDQGSTLRSPVQLPRGPTGRFTEMWGYRLFGAAVARASAIKRSQKPVKATPESKPRGVKAKKAAEERASSD
ncbi:unnamed protein product [Tuber aestivum]|uniref:Ribosomal eL28/Mak16 domain-containing protein n=1 Tax=Tuber aestivum TaxID=59557 RepID=A0A292PXQ7_9PEZI|nr:unnamed protein product [Tuber aestivum]